MTNISVQLDQMMRYIHEDEPDRSAQGLALRTLRTRTFDTSDIMLIVRTAQNTAMPVSARLGAIHVLGFHRFWLKIDLMQDDSVQDIPIRLSEIAADCSENRAVRESAINALGTQFLADTSLPTELLDDEDPFLRREALFVMLNDPTGDYLEKIIAHMTSESDTVVRSGVLWGLARHSRFIECALTMASRSGGAFYLEAIHRACETDPPGTTKGLLAADIKYFDAREALIQRLYRDLDPSRIAILLGFMKDGIHPFAIRILREAHEEIFGDILNALDTDLREDPRDDWAEEATKLSLHYWDRFEGHRSRIRDLIGGWRRYSPRVTRLALGRDIFWKD
jgi:hypothetical protein